MVLAQDLQDMVVLTDTSGMENIYEYEIQMENNRSCTPKGLCLCGQILPVLPSGNLNDKW